MSDNAPLLAQDAFRRPVEGSEKIRGKLNTQNRYIFRRKKKITTDNRYSLNKCATITTTLKKLYLH